MSDEIVEKLAHEQYLAFYLAQGLMVDWDKVSLPEREGWLAVARWTYENVWSAETVVYFPDHK